MSLNIKTADDRNIVAGNVDMATIYRLHDEIDAVSDDVTDLSTDTATKLGGLRFGHDEQGNYGYYKVGADTLTPFSSDWTKYTYIWTSSGSASHTIELEVEPKLILFFVATNQNVDVFDVLNNIRILVSTSGICIESVSGKTVVVQPRHSSSQQNTLVYWA